MATVTVDYLVPSLQIRVGDPTGARYSESWLITSLTEAVKVLGKYWNFKYLINPAGEIKRNPNCPTFVLDEETYGVIQFTDETVIVLMAAIITLEGSLENSAWDAVSWRDNEIAFSNLEQFRTRGDALKKLIDEFNAMVPSPMKRLARPLKGDLPGYSPAGSLGYEKTGQ